MGFICCYEFKNNDHHDDTIKIKKSINLFLYLTKFLMNLSNNQDVFFFSVISLQGLIDMVTTIIINNY